MYTLEINCVLFCSYLLVINMYIVLLYILIVNMFMLNVFFYLQKYIIACEPWYIFQRKNNFALICSNLLYVNKHFNQPFVYQMIAQH